MSTENSSQKEVILFKTSEFATKLLWIVCYILLASLTFMVLMGVFAENKTLFDPEKSEYLKYRVVVVDLINVAFCWWTYQRWKQKKQNKYAVDSTGTPKEIRPLQVVNFSLSSLLFYLFLAVPFYPIGDLFDPNQPNNDAYSSIVLGLILWSIYGWLHGVNKRRKRDQYIQKTHLSNNIWVEFQKKFPELTRTDYLEAEQVLRDFFRIRLYTEKHIVLGMPSKIVDELWHGFILDTRAYHDFCQTAFGSFFHHIPASSMSPTVSQEESLQITWEKTCTLYKLNPTNPTTMPPLFSIDQRLIPNHGNVFYLSETALDEAIQNGKPFGGYACANGLGEHYKRVQAANNSGGGGSCGGSCGG